MREGGSHLMGYPGSKAGAGVWQRIISQMPPHRNYFEGFLGSGVILQKKRPAPGLNVGLDADARVVAAFPAIPAVTAKCVDVLRWLSFYTATVNDPETLIYLDPPYPLSTRNGRRYYEHELTDEQHAELLGLVNRAGAMVMISGYHCELYDSRLAHWRAIEYMAMTRGGPRQEVLWCNFPEPLVLHDYRWLGSNFRERERLKRMKRRWVDRLTRMQPLERRMLLAAIADCSMPQLETTNGE